MEEELKKSQEWKESWKWVKNERRVENDLRMESWKGVKNGKRIEIVLGGMSNDRSIYIRVAHYSTVKLHQFDTVQPKTA